MDILTTFIVIAFISFIFCIFLIIPIRFKNYRATIDDLNNEVAVQRQYVQMFKQKEIKAISDRVNIKEKLEKRIDSLQQEIILLKKSYISDDNKNSGFNENIIDSLFKREEKYKIEILEMERYIEKINTDLRKSEKFKEIFAENFELNKQVKRDTKYITSLEEKMNEEMYQIIADTALLRRLDEKNQEIWNLTEDVKYLKIKLNSN